MGSFNLQHWTRIGAMNRARWRSAGFQTCCIADFQVGNTVEFGWPADSEIRDTADLEVCATLVAASPRNKSMVHGDLVAASCSNRHYRWNHHKPAETYQNRCGPRPVTILFSVG